MTTTLILNSLLAMDHPYFPPPIFKATGKLSWRWLFKHILILAVLSLPFIIIQLIIHVLIFVHPDYMPVQHINAYLVLMTVFYAATMVMEAVFPAQLMILELLMRLQVDVFLILVITTMEVLANLNHVLVTATYALL